MSKLGEDVVVFITERQRILLAHIAYQKYRDSDKETLGMLINFAIDELIEDVIRNGIKNVPD